MAQTIKLALPYLNAELKPLLAKHTRKHARTHAQIAAHKLQRLFKVDLWELNSAFTRSERVWRGSGS
jgi:hypothetical protein